MKYKGLIFDFNGVLLWDHAWHMISWGQAAKNIRGTELSEDEFNKHFSGKTNKEGFEYILGKKLEEGVELNELVDSKEQIYRDYAIKQKDFQLSPGAVNLLDLLKENKIPFTIATSSEIKNTRFFFENLNLGKWFEWDKIVYDNGKMPSKPAPDIYLKAAEGLGVNIENCIVVEDSIAGLASANNARAGKIIAVAHDGNDDKLAAMPGVKKVVENLGEINLSDFE